MDKTFNTNWTFKRGDISGAEEKLFQVKDWESVTLPHTVKLEEYDSYQAYQGIAWYRKAFLLNKSDSEKKVFVEFGAAMQLADVWVNGTHLHTHFGGYLPFTIDITGSVYFDGSENVIAVKLDNQDNPEIPPGKAQDQLDFLYSGGLYREVSLLIVDKLHITNAVYANKPRNGGVFVTYPSVSDKSADIHIRTNVVNEHQTAKNVVVKSAIIDHKDRIVAEMTTASEQIDQGNDHTFEQMTTISEPALWHPNHPYLYKLMVVVCSDNEVIDHHTVRMGIRSVQFSTDSGFLLNGESFTFMGANHHQSFPYIGNAGSAAMQYREAVKLKESGFQFIRKSHYPAHPAFLDACDELGILVLSPVPGWQFVGGSTFLERSYQDLRDMIRRDRNHPCIIAWEASLNESDYDENYARTMVDIVHDEYPGAYAAGWKFDHIYDIFMDASQHNIRLYEGTKPAIICEYGDWDYGGNESTSRVARSDGEAAMLLQAQNFQESLNKNRALNWYIGDGLWVAIDYARGYHETTERSGVYDLARLPKFSNYLYASQRDPLHVIPGIDSGPVIYIANYWTSNSTRDIKIFSNCDLVELHVNGSLYASRSHDQDDLTSNHLKYPPFTFKGVESQGVIEAVGIIDGKAVAAHIVRTPGDPYQIKLEVDISNRSLQADGADAVFVHAYVVDEEGIIVPTANHFITFTVSGQAKLIGESILETNSILASAGVASVLVQSTLHAGEISIEASSDELLTGRLSFNSEQ